MTGFKIETQHGSPLRVGDREITPEARVWSLHVKQLSLSEDGASGGGFHWSWSQPTALIERSADTTRRVRVRDFNLELEWALLLAAIVVPVLLMIFTRWARSTPPIRH